MKDAKGHYGNGASGAPSGPSVGGLVGGSNEAGTPAMLASSPNAPMLGVLRRDSAASSASLHMESSMGLLEDLEESDEESGPRTGSDKRSGRRKIKIEYIEDKNRRHITFSKRKAGIMKKAYELSTLTGTQVLLLVASETGHVYTFATPKLQPLITKQEGKNLIQACLNSPDPMSLPDYNQPSPAPLAPGSSNNTAPGNAVQAMDPNHHHHHHHHHGAEGSDEDMLRPTSASFASAIAGLTAGYPGPSASGASTSGQGQNSSAPNAASMHPGSNTSPSSVTASAAAAAAAQVFMNPNASASGTGSVGMTMPIGSHPLSHSHGHGAHHVLHTHPSMLQSIYGHTTPGAPSASSGPGGYASNSAVQAAYWAAAAASQNQPTLASYALYGQPKGSQGPNAMHPQMLQHLNASHQMSNQSSHLHSPPPPSQSINDEGNE